MSVLLVSVDYATLPTALLASAKAHCRVDHSHDDALLTDVIARAIDQFERFTERHVFAASAAWSVTSYDFCNGRAKAAVQPIVAFTADAGGADVSTSYTASAEGAFAGAQIWFINGVYQAGLSFLISTGYDAADAIPPGIRDLIFKMVAARYENRQIMLPAGQFLSPNWLEHELAAYWLPRA